MHRVESNNYIVEDGKQMFSDSPPATTVSASWLNSIQEEICNVIEGSGLEVAISKDNDTRDQLYQAIQAFLAVVTPSTYFPIFNDITGTVTNDAGDTDHDLSFGAGSCLDSTRTKMMTDSGMIKRFDTSWASGTNAGGFFPAGSLSADTVYYTFKIMTASGFVDYGCDTSITAANRPAGYTYYRCIGAFVTNSSSNIINGTFWRQGNQFHFKPNDFIVLRAREAFGSTSRILITHTYAPPNSYATLIYHFAYDSATAYYNYGSTSDTDLAPSSYETAKVTTYNSGTAANIPDLVQLDGSKQSYVRCNGISPYCAVKSEQWYIIL